jgi:ribosomal protein S18 acetylase RimI-like enzyme
VLDDESSLKTRQASSQREFFRLLGKASQGSSVVSLPGSVQATAAPIRPWYSIFNSVVFRDAEVLLEQLDDLASFYRAAGSQAWAIWVPPWQELDEELANYGMKIDSNPMLMAARIDELDLTPRLDLELMEEATAYVVAQVNDQAHGVLPEWSMTAVFENLSDRVKPYVALVDDRPASALLALQNEGDCYFWFVATAPEARRRGLASELVRHALREAQQAGCTTTTLESTAMAEETYERLGFRPFGRYRMWEWRSS